MLDNKLDNATYTSEIGERPARTSEDPDETKETKKRRPKLEELTRFTMVKRIW